ncbi:hypothetical protein Tco_1291662, partial [Tanacetum coccineum]
SGDTPWKQTNDKADLAKHLNVDSSRTENVRVEADKSNESLGNTSNVVTPCSSNPFAMLMGKPTVVGNELVINEVPSSYANKLALWL